MTNFKVGQKVVCIDDSWIETENCVCPVKNKIYTIRKLIDQPQGLFLLFDEIKNKKVHSTVGFVEPRFYSLNFKPVQYQSAAQEILSKFPLTEEKADTQIKELQKLENR